MGAFSAWLITESKEIGVVLVISFLVYEIMNDWRKVDWSYKDVCGFVWGLAIAGLVLKLTGMLVSE